jgi:hypothetical protein
VTDGFFNGVTSTGTARLLSAASSDNATSALQRPCVIKGIQGYNAKASGVYLKIYDETTVPTSSDTPRKTLYLPATSAFSFDFSYGVELANGLGYRLTTGSADNDTGVLIAGDVLGLNIDYS